ncbi:MAG: aminotransferase class I/II-fold pyridoxal phosphate-dependent enzyme [Muribaculaceae bacterium]|nr:aminotransferase class I/II-fold pyridoxal phosphate-dependent enzyme [Muribaculaceae bacterium]
MSQSRILLCLAHMSGNEMKYIEEAFADNWVVPLGPNVDGFEHDLEEFVNSREGASPLDKRVVALSAGTAAIHLGLIQLGVGPGDEVLCQSFTFSASANPVTYQGATPVFVDSEPDTWNMSPELLEQAILDRKAKTGRYPKAIIIVYLYGMPAKIDELIAIADKYGIPVLEDAAEALGSRYRGQYCGTFGRYGALSFNGNKMITTSGGGALIVPSDKEKKEVMFYATQAREPFPYYQHEKIGYNYRMSNICAGIGRGQMTILEEHIAHHRHVHQLYAEAFADMDGITLHSNPEEKFDANYWLCNILIDKDTTGFDYEELRQYLDKAGIESRPLWKPMHLQPVFAACPAYVNGVSEDLFGRGLCLPAGPWVGDREVEYIVETIKSLYRR